MIRLALPKGRNLETALAAFAAGGLDLSGLDSAAARDSRRLWHAFPELGCEVLLLKDRDLPLYVGRGIADCGVVGRDVLEEVDGDLLRRQRVEHVMLVLAEFHQHLAEPLGFLQCRCLLARRTVSGGETLLVLEVRLQLRFELAQVLIQHR